MSTPALEAVVKRLEAVATRLEASAHAGGGAAPAPTGPAKPGTPAAAGTAASTAAFDALLAKELAALLAAAKEVGGPVQAVTELLQKAFAAERAVVVTLAACKPPGAPGLQKLLTPLGAVLAEINAKTEGKRTDEFNHFKALAEASQGLTWVAFQPGSGMPLPGTQVEEAWSSAEFWTNKVLMQYRGKNDKQVTWATALKELFAGLRGFVKQHHAAGPSWNAGGVDVAEFNPSGAPAPRAPGGPPPPPPPPPGGPGSLIRDAAPASTAPAKPAGGNMNALFSEINRGETVSVGLRKVTDDMKTKNRADRSGAVPAADAKAPAAAGAAKVGAAAPGGQPKVACEGGRKWVVENQVNAGQVTVSEVNPKQTVYIYNCSNTVIHVTGKINSLCVDKCSRTSVLLTDVVAACEIVNSSGTQVQVTGVAPTLAIDNCAGVQLYLSAASLGCSITTCKSTEVNVLIPGATPDDDMRETPIPEQFVTTFTGGKWVTTTMEHSAG